MVAPVENLFPELATGQQLVGDLLLGIGGSSEPETPVHCYLSPVNLPLTDSPSLQIPPFLTKFLPVHQYGKIIVSTDFVFCRISCVLVQSFKPVNIIQYVTNSRGYTFAE
jgi:hypothetical protein